MTYRQLVNLIESDGWRFVRQKGSHAVYDHPAKPGIVVVAGKPSKDVPPGTLHAVLKQAGIGQRSKP
jgi:predicted RNA binding protein YcfA (HicA-like mRNA interferase family)